MTSPAAPESGASSTSAVRIVLVVLAGVSALVAAVAVAVLKFSVQPDPAFAGVLEPAPSAAGLPAALPTARGADQGASRTASRPAVDPSWVSRVATAAGIPAPAVHAYADTELVLRADQPGCHLSWNTLAGLGWIESQHGTIGSRTLGPDGRSSRPVIGPALDGTGSFAAIRPTPASSAWHGDAAWDHAVGPLQFLHSSWARWGADGDGDGTEDPLDIDDAAYAAGRYLCADGHDLKTAAGWNAAIWSYNHDSGYVRSVLAAANTYASRINVR